MINTKKYEYIVNSRSIDHPIIMKALDIVKKFIINKRRILYGGMAIDLSLKSINKPGIYDKYTIPDYDFMSPDFYNDSNELAVILFKAGFPNVSTINAMHVTSRRVRVNFIVVADITYIPPNIYKHMPFIQLDNSMRIIHPDYQRIDMHRAFSFPLENPPTEVFLARSSKDFDRFKLLNEAFPLKSPNIKKSIMEKSNIIPNKYLKNSILGGFIAYGIYKYILDKIITKYKLNIEERKIYDKIIHFSVKTNKSNIKITYPATFSTIFLNTIITDDFKNIIHIIPHKKREYYNQFLDNLRPKTILLNNVWEIFDIKGELLSVQHIDINNITYKICVIQYVLVYFLQKYFEKRKKIYLAFYNSTLNIIKLADIIFTKSKIELCKKMFLSSQMYGQYNWNPPLIIFKTEYYYRLNNIKNNKKLRPPFGFYPQDMDSLTWEQFDTSKSDFFLINGRKRKKPFKELELIKK